MRGGGVWCTTINQCSLGVTGGENARWMSHRCHWPPTWRVDWRRQQPIPVQAGTCPLLETLQRAGALLRIVLPDPQGWPAQISGLSLHPIYEGPSECDDVIRRAHVSRSRGLPHREVTDGLRRPPSTIHQCPRADYWLLRGIFARAHCMQAMVVSITAMYTAVVNTIKKVAARATETVAFIITSSSSAAV